MYSQFAYIEAQSTAREGGVERVAHFVQGTNDCKILPSDRHDDTSRILQKNFPYNRPKVNEFIVVIVSMYEFHLLDHSKCRGLGFGNT
jgi:hypothetical protein